MKKLLRNTRSLTILSVMLALTVILDSTPLGAIPLGSISATITHIPAIISGIILGPLAGFIMGTILGFISLLHALTRPVTPLDPLFINPLISVLPRMFIGIISYYVYEGLIKVTGRNSVGAIFAGVAGSLTNTFLVFLMLYLVYAQEVAEKIGIAFKVLFISAFTTNAIAEALVSAFVTMAIVVAYKNYNKK